MVTGHNNTCEAKRYLAACEESRMGGEFAVEWDLQRPATGPN
jgi:hypothetical protein